MLNNGGLNQPSSTTTGLSGFKCMFFLRTRRTSDHTEQTDRALRNALVKQPEVDPAGVDTDYRHLDCREVFTMYYTYGCRNNLLSR